MLGRSAIGGLKAGEVGGEVAGVADAEEQDAVGAGAEGEAVGGDGGQRVLALEAGGEAEGDEGDDGAGGDVEGGGGRVWRLGGDRVGDDGDVAGGEGGRHGAADGVGGEAGGRPDLVNEAEAGVPRGGDDRQLPRPDADDPAAAQQVAARGGA